MNDEPTSDMKNLHHDAKGNLQKGNKSRIEEIKEFSEYGYITIGETENDETIVAKQFDSGVVLVMSVHKNRVTQIRFTPDQFEALQQIRS